MTLPIVILVWLGLGVLVALGLHAANGRRNPDDVWCICRRPKCKRCNALRRQLGGRE